MERTLVAQPRRPCGRTAPASLAVLKQVTEPVGRRVSPTIVSAMLDGRSTDHRCRSTLPDGAAPVRKTARGRIPADVTFGRCPGDLPRWHRGAPQQRRKATDPEHPRRHPIHPFPAPDSAAHRGPAARRRRPRRGHDQGRGGRGRTHVGNADVDLTRGGRAARHQPSSVPSRAGGVRPKFEGNSWSTRGHQQAQWEYPRCRKHPARYSAGDGTRTGPGSGGLACAMPHAKCTSGGQQGEGSDR